MVSTSLQPTVLTKLGTYFTNSRSPMNIEAVKNEFQHDTNDILNRILHNATEIGVAEFYLYCYAEKIPTLLQGENTAGFWVTSIITTDASGIVMLKNDYNDKITRSNSIPASYSILLCRFQFTDSKRGSVLISVEKLDAVPRTLDSSNLLFICANVATLPYNTQ